MGAKIEVDGNVAIVHGPAELHGTGVVAHDLRTGMALILAGLAADGETVVAPGYLIDRGHAGVAERRTARTSHAKLATRTHSAIASYLVIVVTRGVFRAQSPRHGHIVPFPAIRSMGY